MPEQNKNNNQGNKEQRSVELSERKYSNKSTYSRINPASESTPPKKKE